MTLNIYKNNRKFRYLFIVAAKFFLILSQRYTQFRDY